MIKASFTLFLASIFSITFSTYSQNQELATDSVYTIVEVHAKPIGGMKVILNSLKSMPSCLYRKNKRMGIDSKYFFRFIISKKGRLETNSFKVLRPKERISEDCLLKMKEILSEIIWKPAEYNCNKVRQQITFPLLICMD
jgi:hypothetical protein